MGETAACQEGAELFGGVIASVTLLGVSFIFRDRNRGGSPNRVNIFFLETLPWLHSRFYK